MPSDPLISCIVPVFNGERFLAEAIESILAQTYRPIEVVVADDGSTDGTRRVAEQFDGQLRFESHSTAGPAETRNLGVRTSRGELIAFLDADDLWHADKLSRQAERFRLRPELDACVTHVQLFWEPNLVDEREQYENHPRSAPVPGYATTSLLARRAIFERVGWFNPDLWCADATDWFIRARERHVQIELLPDVLVYHRMHERNLTRRRSVASGREFLRVLKTSLDRRRSEKRGSIDVNE